MLGSTLLSSVLSIWSQSRKAKAEEQKLLITRGEFQMKSKKQSLDHGLKVAQELAHVLSGGDTSIEKTLSEDDLYKLELDAFMRLIETKETQDRIKHTLATGKPLVN